MINYSFFFIFDFNMVFCKANCSFKNTFRDRRVKLGNIKYYEYIIVFIWIFLNQRIISYEFFHWFNCSLFLKLWLILSKIDLLIFFPMSLLEGLIKRHGNDYWKFGLWSFSDINRGFLARHSILISRSNFFEMCLPSVLIAFSKRSVDFR